MFFMTEQKKLLVLEQLLARLKIHTFLTYFHFLFSYGGVDSLRASKFH